MEADNALRTACGGEDRTVSWTGVDAGLSTNQAQSRGLANLVRLLFPHHYVRFKRNISKVLLVLKFTIRKNLSITLRLWAHVCMYIFSC